MNNKVFTVKKGSLYICVKKFPFENKLVAVLEVVRILISMSP